MSFWDNIGALADRLGIGSEGYVRPEPQNYPPAQDDYDYQTGGYDQPEYDPAYANQEQPYYSAPDPQQQEPAPYYESNFGAGEGYSRAGARPRSAPKPKGKGVLGGITDRMRAPQGQGQQTAYTPRQGNVIPFSGQGHEDEAPYRAAKNAGGNQRYEPRQAQQPQQQPQPAGRQAPPTAQSQRAVASTIIFLVRMVEEAEEIISHMMEGGNVIVNLEEIDEALKQRVLDMVSGAAFALDCSIKRISYRNYLIAPAGEEVISNVSSRDRERDMEPEADDGYGYRSSRPRY